MGRYSGLRGGLRWALDVMAMDRLEIRMYGDDAAWAMFRDVTARHPRLKVSIGSYGPSLVRLSGWDGGYLQGGDFADARRKARRAAKAGYTVRPINADGYRGELLEIHRSTPARQGIPMKPDVLTEEGVARAFGNRQGNGVFDAGGRLRGYMLWIDAGEVIVLRGVMGHAEFLRDGIMYLLFSETIREAIEKCERGGAAWLQYTWHHRQGDGMRRFKHELGFRPYRVAWRWDRSRAR